MSSLHTNEVVGCPCLCRSGLNRLLTSTFMRAGRSENPSILSSSGGRRKRGRLDRGIDLPVGSSELGYHPTEALTETPSVASDPELAQDAYRQLLLTDTVMHQHLCECLQEA